MSRYFITASGTGVGKTLVMTTLCWQLRQQGKKVTAIKPVITGFDPDDAASDSALILKSCGLQHNAAMMKTISPWQYAPPLAPPMAADKPENIPDLDEVVQFCRDHDDLNSNIILAEGAGGVMAPLTARHTMRDVMQALNWPVILVGGSYLGGISHTLSAYEALRVKNIPIQAVILCESENSTVGFEDTVQTIEQFIPADVPLGKIPRLQAGESKWKHAPHLHWVIEHDG